MQSLTTPQQICRRIGTITAFALVASSCGEATGPADQKTIIARLAGDAQFGTAGASLADPLQVVVSDALSKQPREGVTVSWQVTDGGAAVTPATSTTDSRGIASATLRLGTSLGTAHVRASTANQSGDPAAFTATSVQPPVITSIAQLTARAGDTITVNGTNFGTTASSIGVLFDGIRGTIISISNERIRVVVPACVASHNATVRVALGAVVSAPSSISTTARAAGALRMVRGEVRSFTDPGALACLTLPPDPAGASYMIIPQNVTETYSISMPFELAAFGVVSPIALRAASVFAASNGGATGAAAATGTAPGPTFASDWERALREREQALTRVHRALPLASLRTSAQTVVPNVGDRRDFNTLNSSNQIVRITAVVRAVTQHAILYQDIAAADLFTAADYQHFGSLFDDPIYLTDTSVFGTVSDIDGNGHVIVILTPQVNLLTPKGAGSYIAGYFYACDLLKKSECSATNSGEIFYGIVPDVAGKFGDVHTAASVLRTVPPVIAHEFMHMINYSQRGSLDDLWLGEALAHTAEDVVGQVFIDRGDRITGADFIDGNHSNARLYLSRIGATSLIANETPGTIELRGAGWLFLRYLRGLYGENALLGQLTRSQTSGSRNITSHTGKTWAALMSDFATAIYADDAPDLAGVTLDPRYTFVNINIRETLGTVAVHSHTFSDFMVSGALPSSAWQYEYVQTPATLSSASLNIVFSGAVGGAFTSAAIPQLTVLRVR